MDLRQNDNVRFIIAYNICSIPSINNYLFIPLFLTSVQLNWLVLGTVLKVILLTVISSGYVAFSTCLCHYNIMIVQ